MKFSAVCTIAAAVMVSTSQVQALKAYLAKIPNGDSFTQELGHPNDDSSQYTDFATAFEAAELTWDATFCKADFKTTDTTISMTNGEAFGDPCCTWKAGATPDFSVTAFTISPTKKTVCASSSSSSSSTPVATTATPSTTTATPASTTATPNTTTATPTTTTATPTATTATPTSTTATPTTTKATSKSKKHKDKKHKDKKHKTKKHKSKKDETPTASSNSTSSSSEAGGSSTKCNVSRR